MKVIAVDLTPILPGGENGGAKVFVLELIRHLAELAPQTNFVLLTQFASHAELATLDRPNVRRHLVLGAPAQQQPDPIARGLGKRILPRLPGRVRHAAIALADRLKTSGRPPPHGSLLQGIGADLLFCPFTGTALAEAGVPMVTTIHDLQYRIYPEFFTPADIAHRDQAFIGACRHSTVLAAVSNYSRDEAIREGPIEPDRIRTIHHRMSRRIASEHLVQSDVLPRLRLVPGHYLIYTANFWLHKNHEMLLTAFAMARANGLPDDVKLVCTGAPSERQRWLAQACTAMGLEQQVVFPGYVSSNDLAILVGSALAVVFPSLYEGFGLPVIEAMAAGVPVICSNTTSLPEVAGNAAVLFDPRVPASIEQAIRLIASDPALREQLMRKGLERAAEFADSRRMAMEYLELLRFARTHAKRECRLSGVYPDGWMGNRLTVHTTDAEGQRFLEMDILAPDWLPYSKLTLRAHSNGKAAGQVLRIAKGSSARWSIPLTATASDYDIVIEPSFVPSHDGVSQDTRRLSAMLKHCAISHAGSSINLYPAAPAQ